MVRVQTCGEGRISAAKRTSPLPGCVVFTGVALRRHFQAISYRKVSRVPPRQSTVSLQTCEPSPHRLTLCMPKRRRCSCLDTTTRRTRALNQQHGQLNFTHGSETDSLPHRKRLPASHLCGASFQVRSTRSPNGQNLCLRHDNDRST